MLTIGFGAEKQSIINSVQVKEPPPSSSWFEVWLGILLLTFYVKINVCKVDVRDACRNESLCYSYNYSSGGKTIPVNVSYHFKTVHEFKKTYLKKKEAASKEVTVWKSRKRRRPKILPENIKAKTI